MALGRRDLFVLSWLVLAAGRPVPLILIWAVVMAAANATVAIGPAWLYAPTCALSRQGATRTTFDFGAAYPLIACGKGV